MRIRATIRMFPASMLLSACASNPGVRAIGPDLYMVSRQAATGFSGLGSLKADAFAQASKYCAEQKRELKVVTTNESQPPYVLGNFPRAEVQFMCLQAGDPHLTPQTLEPRPDLVIENRTRAPAREVEAKESSANGALVAVTIESEPSSADVYLDSAFVGSTPLANYGLSAGSHLIEVSKSGFAKWSRKILVKAGVPTHVSATLERAPAEQPAGRQNQISLSPNLMH